jgi:hypothetical protein
MSATPRRREPRLSRRRILALAETARYRHGWSVHSLHSHQRCPCCHATVRAPLPNEGIAERTPEAIDAYHARVINLLNDAVIEHLHRECPTPGKRR